MAMHADIASRLRLGAVALGLAASLLLSDSAALAEGNPAPTGCAGGAVIDGGTSSNVTNIDIAANGGTAIGDATGGDENLAETNDRDDDEKRRGGRGVLAEEGDTASAGNGGVATAAANGGAVSIGNVNSGNNTGNTVQVGRVGGSGHCSGGSGGSGSGGQAVLVSGGTNINETNIDISVDGGTAIADASGGDNNVAATGGSVDGGDVASAGNGGVANAAANGGAVTIGDVNSGGNSGNTVIVGEIISGGAPPPAKPNPPKKPDVPGVKKIDKGKEVASLPSTGAGIVQGSGATGGLLLLATAVLAVGAAGTALRKRIG
jgi:hypothetical protein